MPDRAAQKAQDIFLQQQKKQAPKLIIGDASTAPPIGTEGLILIPTKRTKEEEERLAKTKEAVLSGPGQIQQSGGRGITAGMGGRRRITKP